MARTFNRNPMSMPMPSKGDIQDYYFSHSEFKGLDNSKNYITTDPNTFADCKNVYVDLEGLLRSRPVIKNEQVLITASSGTTELTNILNVYTFGKITLYHTDKKLTIYNPDVQYCKQMTLPDDNIKPVLAEGKIFIFTSSKLMYYDVVTDTIYSDAEECIYVPITKLVTNGSESDLEQPNELTTYHKIRYLFTHVEGTEEVKNDYDILLGKTLTFTIDGNKYTRTFTKYTKYTLVHKLTTPMMNSNAIISVSDEGSIMFALKSSSSTEYTLWYSHDGIGYSSFKTRADVVSVPSISANGKYVCCASPDEIYIAKILDDGEGNLEKWEKLQHTYSNLDSAETITFFESSSIKMLDEDNYSVIVKSDSTSLSDRGVYPKLLVCYNKSRKLYRFFDSTVGYLRTNITSEYAKEVSVNVNVVSNPIYEQKLSLGSLVYYEDNVKRASIIPNWTFKSVVDGNNVNVYIKGSTKYEWYKSDGITVNYSTTNAMSMDVLLPKTGTVIIDDIKVSYTVSKSGNDYSFTVKCEKYHVRYMYDRYHNISACFCSYFEDMREATSGITSVILGKFKNTYPKIDMHIEGEKYYVATNYGEIFVVTSDTDRIIYVDNPWRNVYYMQNYDVSITATELHYTCPAYITSTNAIMHRAWKYEHTDASTKYIHNSDTYINVNSKSAVSKDGRVLVRDKLYIDSEPVSLLFVCTPVCFTKKGMYLLNYSRILYTDTSTNVTTFDETKSGNFTYIVPEHVSEIGNFYASVGKTLYISSYPPDGEFKWYFPKINTEVFDQDIHGLHPTSATEMAVFLQDGVYNIQTSESGYLYYRTKLQVGVKNGAGIVTSYDGKYTIFPTYRGMVALTYQDFVATTEQVLTFLTDSILQTFKDYYSTDSIKLFKYDFWIICYKPGDNKYLVFDMRNNSWWPMELLYNIDKFVLINDEVHILCNGKLYKFKHDDDNYYDDNSYVNEVEWYFTSQQLHLNAPNNYKHISSITLTSVLDSDVDLYFDLILYNYRKKLHKSDVDSFKFKVDTVRSYVKRLNYSKVGKFQYLLTSILNDAADDYEDAARTPLSISNITIKYKVSGQVR